MPKRGLPPFWRIFVTGIGYLANERYSWELSLLSTMVLRVLHGFAPQRARLGAAPVLARSVNLAQGWRLRRVNRRLWSGHDSAEERG